jgi:hypothetical protein
MSNVVSLPNKRDWKYHADRINAAWGKQVESILETGRYLIEAKEELSKDAFASMCKLKLSFKTSAVSMLMAVAENKVLFYYSKKALCPLPPFWRTLYELSKLDDATLRAKIEDGTIHPKLEQCDAVRLVEELRGPSLMGRVRDAFGDAKNGLTSDELHKQIGSNNPTTMRGYVSRLAKEGELVPTGEQRKGAGTRPASVYVLNKNYQAPAKPEKKSIKATSTPAEPQRPTIIEPQAQRDEMRRSYVTFLVTLAKEDQVEEITKIIRRELGWTTKEISLFLSSNYPRTKFKI